MQNEKSDINVCAQHGIHWTNIKIVQHHKTCKKRLYHLLGIELGFYFLHELVAPDTCRNDVSNPILIPCDVTILIDKF